MPCGWRLAASEFASSPAAMMSGEGAFLHGGRWNSKGVRLVYLGTSLAQAAMELLIHLGRSSILKNYSPMGVSFGDALVQQIAMEDLPENWLAPGMASAAQSVGDAWAEEGSSLILQVPSAVVVGEYNYLYNPLHPDSAQAKFSEITPFNFDSRLLK